MTDEIHEFVAHLLATPRDTEPSDEQLNVLARKLIQLATSPSWASAIYREALPGEELLYELAVSQDNGPSLYLVSDGPAVVSPPHEHKTWAIIAGIRGRETNRRFAINSGEARVAEASSVVEVGPGEVLILSTNEIHATEVNTNEATFHLHLYGRPLHALPRFESRCYSLPLALE